jgi:p-hydroxybenzoate 3-monooxygenase
MRTQVAIVGGGPAGLMLGRLLELRGIDSVILEARDREYVQQRVRAGVLEQATMDLMDEVGLGARMHREGLVHHGVELRFGGEGHRIALSDLTGGRAITIYGQQEVVKDLIAARLESGLPLFFEVSDVTVDAEAPQVEFTHEGERHTLECDLIAGCDGFHGVCRDLVPDLQVAERAYPFAWLGVLAQAAPTQEELIYANHERGFALYSMRSPTITRLYLQVPADEDAERWPDDRIWDELSRRLPTTDGFTLNTGPILEKGVTAMRSFVATPMRHGSLVLAGDAAHIVPPTGAKGMNLAIADVAVLAEILEDVLVHGKAERLDDYTPTCMQRVWRAQHFSSWMTSMTHRFGDDPFQRQLQLSELTLVTTSRAAATNLAQNYVGLPFGWPREGTT